MFGLLSLVVALAVLATLPVLQFLSLGYLLEVGGRVVRERSPASGFVGVRKAARLGGIVLGAWLVLLPLRFVSLMVDSARLIAPGQPGRSWLDAGIWILYSAGIATCFAALLRGGRFRHFLWPAPIRLVRRLAAPGAYAAARDAVWDYVVGLRLPYYFWLGVRGFLQGAHLAGHSSNAAGRRTKGAGPGPLRRTAAERGGDVLAVCAGAIGCAKPFPCVVSTATRAGSFSPRTLGLFDRAGLHTIVRGAALLTEDRESCCARPPGCPAYYSWLLLFRRGC